MQNKIWSKWVFSFFIYWTYILYKTLCTSVNNSIVHITSLGHAWHSTNLTSSCWTSAWSSSGTSNLLLRVSEISVFPSWVCNIFRISSSSGRSVPDSNKKTLKINKISNTDLLRSFLQALLYTVNMMKKNMLKINSQLQQS